MKFLKYSYKPFLLAETFLYIHDISKTIKPVGGHNAWQNKQFSKVNLDATYLSSKGIHGASHIVECIFSFVTVAIIGIIQRNIQQTCFAS